MRDGARLSTGDSPDGSRLWITRSATAARAEETVTLPRPRGGVGGQRLIVSPDERNAALFVFSGQSSQGVEVFALEPALAHAGSLPHEYGEGRAPLFSPDGKWLAMLVAPGWACERVSGVPFEADPTSSEIITVDWAILHLFDTHGRRAHRVVVGVDLPRSKRGVNDWRATKTALQLSDHDVTLPMPWGSELTVPLPPPPMVTAPFVRPSAKRRRARS